MMSMKRLSTTILDALNVHGDFYCQGLLDEYFTANYFVCDASCH